MLDDLETFKLPALRQAGLRLAAAGPRIVLFSRSGFKQSLVQHAAARGDVELITVDRLVADLIASKR